MILLPDGATEPLERLISLLDIEIDLLQQRQRQFDTLNEVLISRDDKGLERLLHEMEQAQHTQSDTDLKLQATRRSLAEALRVKAGELTLSLLIAHLPDSRASALDYRRNQIVLLAEALRKQHLRAVMLLSESARVNQMLLESLFPKSESVTTYSADGSDSWRPDTGLVDTEY